MQWAAETDRRAWADEVYRRALASVGRKTLVKCSLGLEVIREVLLDILTNLCLVEGRYLWYRLYRKFVFGN